MSERVRPFIENRVFELFGVPEEILRNEDKFLGSTCRTLNEMDLHALRRPKPDIYGEKNSGN
jgi:hypothetical protein